MSKRKPRKDPSQTKQLKSPLTKELLEKIKENFEMEMEDTGGLSAHLRNQIISMHKKTIDETVNEFIRNLLTTVISDWADEDDRRTNNGRRRIDGIV